MPADRLASRRGLLAASVAAIGTSALGFERFVRVNPKLKGLSLSSYSLRERMQWRWGTKTDRPMTMSGFFDYAARLGCDAVEPTSYFFSRPVRAVEVATLRRDAHLLGLDVSSAAMGNDFSWPPTSERGKENLAYVREWIERLADLGAPALRVFASRRPPKELCTEDLIANVTANLAQALPFAQRCGVLLGLENHDLVRDPDVLLEIVHRVDSPWLGVCWDSGNLLPTPDPYSQLERLAPRAVIAQIKATTPVNGMPEPADYRRLAELLRDARYAGYLVFEYEEAEDPDTAIPRELAKLRAALG